MAGERAVIIDTTIGRWRVSNVFRYHVAKRCGILQAYTPTN